MISKIKYMVYLILTMVLFFDGGTAFCQQKLKKKIKPWDINFSLSSFYDNNVLKNSDKYIERFKNNEDRGRFHINRYDDLVMEYDLRFSYRHQFIKKLNSILYAEAGHNAYSYNSEKTWSSFSFGLQQFIAAPTSIMLSYTHIPEFYVKHYRDNDWVNVYGFTPETFKPFAFSKNDFSFWLQQNFSSSTKARAYFSYMQYFYNEFFTEYDSDNIMYGLRVFHSFSRKISADAGYRYINSDAKGYDKAGETKLTSDDVDGSYNEHILLAGVEYQLPQFMKVKNSLGFSGQYSYRSYTSEKSGTVDPIHAGRRDNFYSLNLSYNIALLQNISITAFFRWIDRNSETDITVNNEFLSEEKDYSQNLVGLSFLYNFKF